MVKKIPNILKILSSNYCRLVFVVSFFVGYLLLPEIVFHTANRVLALFYLLVFSSLMTCVIRNVKEKIGMAQRRKSSFLGTIAIIIGFSAFQFCGISAPVCGASIGVGFLSVIFPNFLSRFFLDNGELIIYLSIIAQLAALHYIGCLKMDNKK